MTLQVEGWGVGVANKELDRWPWPEIDCRTTEDKELPVTQSKAAIKKILSTN